MKKIINVNGQRVRRAVLASGYTKEQVVAHVQDAGLKFSLAGLDKIYRGELPVKDSDAILEAIAFKCRCLASDFAESEAQTA
jgi:hypothetical protein